MSSESDAAKPASTGETILGCGLLIFLALMMFSCVYSGGDDETDTQAPAAETSAPGSSTSEQMVASGGSRSPTEAERLALVETDPEMKQATDFLGLLINSNGHLCAQVSNVVLVSGSKYEVTCVEYRSGAGRVRYLVDGATNDVTPL